MRLNQFGWLASLNRCSPCGNFGRFINDVLTSNTRIVSPSKDYTGLYPNFQQLWLAREIVQDNPLPWQKPLPQNSLTPGRVALGFGAILAVIGTPACFPKTRGKSQGWPKGKKRTPKIPYPTVKKRYSAPPKSKKTAS